NLMPRCVQTYRDTSAFSFVGFNRSGTSIVTTAFDGTVKLWRPDRPQDKHRRVAHGNRLVGPIALLPDGEVMLFACDGLQCIGLRDLARLEELEPPPCIVVSLAVSPDGRYFASGDSQGRVRLWDALTRREVASTIPFDHPLTFLEFVPESTALVV